MNTGNPVRSAHGLPAMDYFHADRRPVWRRSPGPDAFLRRAIPVHGLRPADLPGKPARHRDLPLGPRIETLSHGLPPAGPALDAGRCQRKARLAYPCGVGPAAHHPGEDAVRRRRTGVGPDQYVYALDSTTIALCLSVFPWAHFRTTKAAVKMHTLLDLRGNIPSFIHISDGKLHDVHALDMLLPEAGAIYVVDRGYVDFARLYVLHQAGAFFVTRAKSNIDAHRVYSAPTDRSTGIICDQTISLDGFYTSGLPRTSAAHPLQGPRVRQDAGLHHQQLLASGRHHLRALQKPLAGGTLLQVDQAASSDQAVLRHVGERGEDADLDCRLGLRPRRHRQEAPRPGRLALHFVTDPLGDPLRENAHTSSTCGRRKQMQRFANNQPIEFIRFLTGH